MANYRAVATGNWSNPATWGGGAVPPDAAGHNIYSNGFTVTIDQNVNVALITNAAITASFVGGGTSAAVGGGFTMTTAFTLTGNIVAGTTSGATHCLTITGSGNTTITATQIYGSNPFSAGLGMSNAAGLINNSTGTLAISSGCSILSGTNNGSGAIYNNSTGTINVSGATIVGGAGSTGSHGGIVNASTGIVNITGSTLTTFNSTNNSSAVTNTGAGSVNITTSTLTGGTAGNAGAGGIQNSSTGVVTITNSTINAGSTNTAVSATNGTLVVNNSVMTATNGQSAISSSATNRLSGTFVSATNGQQAVNSARFVLFNQPTNAYIQHALDGVTAGSFVRFYTADNNLGQANPTDVRSGVSYASGALTGRLTVPARGSVALSVNYGPSMPFTATRSGTTATATLTYSYPLVVGDQITVTGASNSEWNSTYTIASIVSGTSVTFEVPASHSSTAGTGAVMQTTGTAVLDPASIASAVQSALTSQGLTSARAGNLDNLDATVSSRLAPSGTLATVTTLTNAPTVPSASAIASQVRTELGTELGRIDQPISSRLAAADYTAPTAAPSVTAIRQEMDANSTKLANLDATISSRLADADYTAPTSAPTVADIRAELATELGRIDASISSRLADADYVAPTSAPTVADIRTELAVELGRLDASVSSRLAGSSYTAPTTPPTAAEITTAVWAAADKTGYSLTSAERTAIAAAVESSILNEADGQAVLTAIVGAIGNTNLSEVSLVAAVRADLERAGGKLDSIPTTAAPSASAVAGAVRSELTTELARIDAPISGATAPSAATVASAVRSELSTELGRVDAAVSTRLASTAATELAAVKAKTDALNTERLANVPTVNILGTLLAQANS